MTTRQYLDAMGQTAQKWRRLAERRQAHFVELYETGRWRHYYNTHEQFADRMREAVFAAHRWAEIAPRPEDQARGLQFTRAPGH